jgi:hypothetical protein
MTQDMGAKRWGIDSSASYRVSGNLLDNIPGDWYPGSDCSDEDTVSFNRWASTLKIFQQGIANFLWQR